MIRSVVWINGGPSGSHVTTVLPDGERRVSYQYDDRGRGPRLEARLRWARDTLVLDEIWGMSYFKTPVHEVFTVSDGLARWHSRSDDGQEKSGAFYLSVDGVPEETAALIRALQPTGRLALVPSGQAVLERAAERTVEAGGKRAHVTLYLVTGIDFAPRHAWLDDDGELFAQVSSGLSLVRDGWESALPALGTAVADAEQARGRALVARAARRPPAIIIEGARVFDAEHGELRDGLSVVVRGERIVEVAAGLAIPPDAERVDGRGQTLLPGLWDMHEHLTDVPGVLALANGVTTARDMGNQFEESVRRRQLYSDGELAGPRLLLAALVDGPGQKRASIGLLVATAEEARRAVERAAAAGFVQMKIYSSLAPSLVPVIVNLAHARGLRVSGHVPDGMTAVQVVEAGVDELQHANTLFLDFLRDVHNTDDLARLLEVGERAGAVNLDAPAVRAFVDRLFARQVVVDATLGVFEGFYTARPGVVNATLRPVADRLPAMVRRQASAGGLPSTDYRNELYRRSFAKMAELVRRLHERGVPLVIGSDGISGFQLHRELELYVEAGLPAATVLSLATRGAARVMRRSDVGSIAPGQLADLVLVDGDPVADIHQIRRVRWVAKEGVIYDVAALLASVGVGPIK